MAAVLLMVGRGLEQPSVVQRMLDIQATRQKPQYNMAAEVCMLWHYRNLNTVLYSGTDCLSNSATSSGSATVNV